ncbi:hypothetical protein GMLC_35490 [Geomonas limicola]|uniref:Ribbon-helix-helix protein CopG domain-containing protein n=2 Tax=Geomonas TaxID=2651583 RepID=A0A6V8MEW6_9BACT|nr:MULTISPECIES: ribbon-helix-helix protein, CopG family [Geomonas]GFO58472.1 hypothetical protein GMST_07970 [Geomonas silvestris]GFO69970.1 hypothetical protein GMLC_35490 [Geomonas limicola]
MGKTKEHAKHTVVSLRISEDEKRELEEISRQSRTSISELMREAMQLYTDTTK